MTSRTEFLTRTSTLWMLFVATVAITLSFPPVAAYWDLTLIDGISDPARVREVLAGFTPGQKTAHAWITATLDVAYPLAYGGFYGATALRFFPRFAFLALPGFLAIPVDLLEGVIQVLALTGVVDWLALKAVVTPLKTVLFLAGLVIAVAAWLSWVVNRIRRAS